MNDVGIIILNYNTFEDTKNCVESIRRSTRSEYHIYIVDGVSTDDSLLKLSEIYSNNRDMTLIKAPKNGGFSYGNNIGIKQADLDGCKFVVISNPDVIYYDGAIDDMILKLERHPDIGIIGPSIRSLDEEESQLYRKVYTKRVYAFSRRPLSMLGKFFKKLRTEYSKPSSLNDNIFAFYGMVRGCCFTVSMELMKKIGFLDDGVFLYSEEWILAKKLYNRGLKAACDFNARILHKEATSTSQVGSAFQTYHLYLSSFYYLKNYLKCNRIELCFYYIQNIINFGIHSLFSNDYRRMYKKFRLSNRLLLEKDNVKIGDLY